VKAVGVKSEENRLMVGGTRIGCCQNQKAEAKRLFLRLYVMTPMSSYVIRMTEDHEGIILF
jgi:hypothetical protein